MRVALWPVQSRSRAKKFLNTEPFVPVWLGALWRPWHICRPSDPPHKRILCRCVLLPEYPAVPTNPEAWSPSTFERQRLDEGELTQSRLPNWALPFSLLASESDAGLFSCGSVRYNQLFEVELELLLTVATSEV